MASVGKPKTLKVMNRKIILEILRKYDVLSINDISKYTRISKTTVIKIINYLIEIGLVSIVGKGESTSEGGKKPILYKFNERHGYIIAIQIFPYEIYSIITDLTINVLRERSIPIIENESGSKVVDYIIDSCEWLLNKEGIDFNSLVGIGIGAHGITNFNEGVVVLSPHFPSWGKNFRLKDKILERIKFNGLVVIDNQIRFQALAEKVFGIAKNMKNIIVVEGGIGLVAGIIVKGEIKRGVHYLAGEIGHMILNPFEKEECVCGGKGCFEYMVSTKRLLKIAKDLYKDYPESMIFKDKDINDIEVEDIFNASNKGDILARKIIDEAVRWFTIGLSNIILAYDPQIIILQGIYVKAGGYFIQGIRKRINQVSLVNIKKDVKIEYSNFGKEAGVIGAASYILMEYFK